MTTSSQLTLWSEPDRILDRLEQRARLFAPRLLLWSHALRLSLADLGRQRQRAVHELDQALLCLEAKRDPALVISRLVEARRLIGGACILALGVALLQTPGSVDWRRPARALRAPRQEGRAA